MKKIFKIIFCLLVTLQFNVVNAKDIGEVTVKGPTENHSLTMKQVWSMHWLPAINKCRERLPQTKSIYLKNFVLNEQMQPANVFSLWTCRDTK